MTIPAATAKSNNPNLKLFFEMSSESALRRVNVLTNQLAPNCASGGSVQHFGLVKEAAPDEIFNTGIRYRADTDPRKVDLGVGAYRTDEGETLYSSTNSYPLLKIVQ
jgi:hypothetical protein